MDLSEIKLKLQQELKDANNRFAEAQHAVVTAQGDALRAEGALRLVIYLEQQNAISSKNVDSG